MDAPYEATAEVSELIFCDRITTWAGIDALGPGLVDKSKLGKLSSDIERLDRPAIISGHLPVLAGRSISETLSNMMGSCQRIASPYQAGRRWRSARLTGGGKRKRSAVALRAHVGQPADWSCGSPGELSARRMPHFRDLQGHCAPKESGQHISPQRRDPDSSPLSQVVSFMGGNGIDIEDALRLAEATEVWQPAATSGGLRRKLHGNLAPTASGQRSWESGHPSNRRTSTALRPKPAIEVAFAFSHNLPVRSLKWPAIAELHQLPQSRGRSDE
jgi:hypothetical protein